MTQNIQNASLDVLKIICVNLKIIDVVNASMTCKELDIKLSSIIFEKVKKDAEKYFKREEIAILSFDYNNLYFLKNKIKRISKDIFETLTDYNRKVYIDKKQIEKVIRSYITEEKVDIFEELDNLEIIDISNDNSNNMIFSSIMDIENRLYYLRRYYD